ncbi:ComF family protein [Paenibacillus sp. S28]|uniref:ComF family protein n=1 Tax=Paenibacillus sp. S28 TaxID=2767463 RepID=UPI00190BC882|nr:ComF family protein [Paenibacillus sp. S28]
MKSSNSLLQMMQYLLSPPGETCLTCGGVSRLVREWPGICRSCVVAIPWIHNPRCLCCGRAIGCPDCLREEMSHRSFVCNRSAVQYNGVMREWLAQYKYRGHEKYADLIVHMLNQAFVQMQEELSSLLLGLNPKLAQGKLLPSSGDSTSSTGISASSPGLFSTRSSGTVPGHTFRTFHPQNQRIQSDASIGFFSTLSSMVISRVGSVLPELPFFHRLRESSGQALWKPDVITYVPVSDVRLKERGFNQAEVLARGLGSKHRIPVMPLLVRREHTAKQSYKSRQERIDSMKNVFAVHEEGVTAALSLYMRTYGMPSKASHSNSKMTRHESHGHAITAQDAPLPMQILLIDDIYTTGSTINACAEVLQGTLRQGMGLASEVYSLTWARS